MADLMTCLPTKHQASFTIATVYNLTQIFPDEVRSVFSYTKYRVYKLSGSNGQNQNLYACVQPITRRVPDIDSCFGLYGQTVEICCVTIAFRWFTMTYLCHHTRFFFGKPHLLTHCPVTQSQPHLPYGYVWGWGLEQPSGSPLEETTGRWSYVRPIHLAMPCWWGLTRLKQLSMAATPLSVHVYKFWPIRGDVLCDHRWFIISAWIELPSHPIMDYYFHSLD